MPKLADGFMVATAPLIVTCPVVTSTVSNVLSSEAFLIKMSPVPLEISSLNVITKLLDNATSTALSIGDKVVTVGGFVSTFLLNKNVFVNV